MTKTPDRRDRRNPVLEDEMALVELITRVLDRGVVLVGDVTISVAGVDLVQLGLSLYVTSVETVEKRRREAARAVSETTDPAG